MFNGWTKKQYQGYLDKEKERIQKNRTFGSLFGPGCLISALVSLLILVIVCLTVYSPLWWLEDISEGWTIKSDRVLPLLGQKGEYEEDGAFYLKLSF